MQDRNRFAVEIRGDLAFEVVRNDDGSYSVVNGWFDCRSGEDQLSAMVFNEFTENEPEPDVRDAVFMTIPGKGTINV